MPNIENANSARGIGTFPKHWGLPAGTSHSEERTAWIAAKVRADTETRARNIDPATRRSLPANDLGAARARVELAKPKMGTPRSLAGFDLSSTAGVKAAIAHLQGR